MQALVDNDHAEEVPASELARDEKTWYLPHHGVYHHKKPGKIRAVFDWSSKCSKVSLNDVLLSGPDLTHYLLGVLLRFRQDVVAVAGDSDKMFYQVRVAAEHRDSLSYYWWRDGDLSQEPTTYRMKVHLFGAVSSPSVSTYALRQTIEDNREYFSPLVCYLAKRNFYVDDFLCAVPSVEEAIDLVKDVASLCAKGGFRLRKWTSNSRDRLESIPPNDRAAHLVDLGFKTFPTERALGVTWDVENDVILLSVEPKEVTATRRNLLSVLSSIFDPMGLTAPFILPGKILLQELCHKSVQWDVELSSADATRWIKLASKLPDLKKLSYPRCFKPPDVNKDIQTVQLHHFSDASEKAYDTASYVRFEYNNGDIYCALLFGKARVVPLKKITIPRMKLTAACLAVRLNHMLSEELTMRIHSTYYWTDSMSVLRYIQNRTSRFHTFVANRLRIVHGGSEVAQWNYVDGPNNPADLSSRGIDIHDEARKNTCINGPKFMWEPESSWRRNPDVSPVLQDTDSEVKSSNLAVTLQPNILDEMIARFSDFKKLKRN